MEEASAARRREAPAAPSAVERAALRRYAWRVALCGGAGTGLLASLIVALGLALWPAKLPERPSSPQAPPPSGALAFAAELDAIRSEAATRSEREVSDPATKAAVAALAQRIEAFSQQIDTLRTRAEVVPAAPPARAPIPADTAIAALSERLYNLELRQGQAESDRGTLQGQLLARLHDLESRQQSRERDDASALRLLLERVQQLELSRDVAEAKRLDGQNALLARLAALESRLETVPASPHP
jgi:hypothetical protein